MDTLRSRGAVHAFDSRIEFLHLARRTLRRDEFVITKSAHECREALECGGKAGARPCSAAGSERSRVMGCKAHFTRERAPRRLRTLGRFSVSRTTPIAKTTRARSTEPRLQGGVVLVPRFATALQGRRPLSAPSDVRFTFVLRSTRIAPKAKAGSSPRTPKPSGSRGGFSR